MKKYDDEHLNEMKRMFENSTIVGLEYNDLQNGNIKGYVLYIEANDGNIKQFTIDFGKNGAVQIMDAVNFNYNKQNIF